MPKMPPEDWVSPFKEILKRNGVGIDDTLLSGSKGNIFLATWLNRTVWVIAAGSTRIGFWGIAKNWVALLKEKADRWGVVFLDLRDAGKCYWIERENVIKLADSTNPQEYLFHASILEENWELAERIDASDEAELVRIFLLKTGLNEEE